MNIFCVWDISDLHVRGGIKHVVNMGDINASDVHELGDGLV